MSHPPRFLTLWAINDRLDLDTLTSQVDEFAAHGLDGVVFHPRFYPGKPAYLSDEYFEILSKVIIHARRKGLAFWIYDEDGWPSGTAGGQLLAEYPTERQQWLALEEVASADTLLSFEAEQKRWHLTVRFGEGVDYLSTTLGRRFVDMTYARYKSGLTVEAFDHVEAFFDDEPEFGLGHAFDQLPAGGAIPWSPTLLDAYSKRYGESLLTSLPAIFFDLPGSPDVRPQFWELLSDMFAQNYLSPIDEWCRANGKTFTAHLKGEEHPLFQVPTVGSSEHAFQRIGMPGIDALERGVGNEYYPRQASTASRQFSDGRLMAEAFGGAGWGSGPKDLEKYVRWLASNGATDFALHLSQLKLDSAALHDWPPSHPLHVTWAPAYVTLLDSLRTEIAAHQRPLADTLIISPHRAIMKSFRPWEFTKTNVHNASTYPATDAARINDAFLELVRSAHAAGVNYDVVDERTLDANASIVEGDLVIGSAHYSKVLVAPEAAIAPNTRTLIEPFVASLPAPEAVIVPPENERLVSANMTWTVDEAPENELVLEPAKQTDGSFITEFTSEFDRTTQVEVIFADTVHNPTVDGAALTPIATLYGSAIKLAIDQGRRTTRLRFRADSTSHKIFAWVCGDFLAVAESKYAPGSNPAEVVTEGAFILRNRGSNTVLDHDLLAVGYPFLRRPLPITALWHTDTVHNAFKLEQVECDAVRVEIDGKDYGWHWGESIAVPARLDPGEHRVKLTLIPNSYNVYGPHHYVLGDAPAISPAQIEGTRNFIDPGLPSSSTHEPAWHLRRFSIPRVVSEQT